MTVSTEAWRLLMRTFVRSFFMNSPMVDGLQPIPPSVQNLEGVRLYCNDVLQLLRSISSRSTPRFDGDVHFTVNCYEMMLKISSGILSALRRPSMECYVLCLDYYGLSRPEKAYTAKKRSEQAAKREAKGALRKLSIPAGQVCFFEHEQPLPGDMNSVFSTPEARIDLYEYVTSFFRSAEFQAMLPAGKRFVLSGGLQINEPYSKYTRLPPFVVTRDGISVVEELRHHQISEGDLDVWRFVLHYEGNVVVESGDGDVLLAGLVLMRTIFSNNDTRRVWFRTRRSVGQKAHPPELLRAHATRHETYLRVLEQSGGDQHAAYLASDGAIKPQPTTRGGVVWGQCWVDLYSLWASMIQDAHEVHAKLSVEIPCPVEQWVVLMCMASDSHDYFDRKRVIKGAGAKPVWLSYVDNMHDIGPVVRIAEHEDSKHGNFSYMIDAQALRRWSSHAYREVVMSRNKRNSNVNKKLSDAAYEKKINEKASQVAAKHFPGEESVLVGASQLAWVLHYYNTGPKVAHIVISGLDIHPYSGESLYGFVSGGFADRVTSDPLRVCGC